MTALRERMIEDLQLHGLADKTREAYLRAVRQLAAYCNKPPDRISEEELREYFLFLKNERGASQSSCRVALYGIRFFYLKTLRKEWPSLELIRFPQETTLPVVLSAGEVRRVLASVQLSSYQVCLTTIYSCGLRILEGVTLKTENIDGERKQLHIRNAKGGKDRRVPLPERTLEMLRDYWSTHRHPHYVFPAKTPQGISPSISKKPMNASSVRRALLDALEESGVQKHATVHTLRPFLRHSSA